MRKFLVVLDDTRESATAIRYAALRAANTNGMVKVLSVIPADQIQHGMGVADLMRAEAREQIEARFEVFAKWMRDRPGVAPELVIQEGEPAAVLLEQMRDDPEIGVVVLAAAVDSSGPGPLISRLMRDISSLPCPVTIVPGDLDRARMDAIT